MGRTLLAIWDNFELSATHQACLRVRRTGFRASRWVTGAPIFLAGENWSFAMMIVGLVIAGLIAFACHKEAEKFQRLYGRGPWNGSPALWAVVGFLLGLFGALFLVIAESNTKKQIQKNVVWSQPAYLQPGPYAQPQYAQPAPPAAPPAGQWGPPPAPAAPQWTPPSPPGPPGPPKPNVGGSDFLPRSR